MFFGHFTAASLITISLSTTQAHADFWSDAVGVLTDPLKLSESSENFLHTMERALIHAERLQGKIDEDIKSYLTQIDGTVSETRSWITSERTATIEQIEKVVSSTLADVSKLEKAFISDTRELAKCVVETTAESVQSTLANSLNDLGQRRPRFEFLGITLGELKIDASSIPSSPIEGFRQTKALYDQVISEVEEDDPPSVITDAHSEIQRLADLVRCHYKPDTTAFQDLYNIELEYNRRGRAWLLWNSAT